MDGMMDTMVTIRVLVDKRRSAFRTIIRRGNALVTPRPTARPSPHRMTPQEKISIVLPTRNAADRIELRCVAVIEMLSGLGIDGAEIVIVDDGSTDGTSAITDKLCTLHSRVRVMRHARPRGMESAGQTGLDRSTGDVVFIQEDDVDLRVEDFSRLLEISRDRSIVAARVESVDHAIAPELLRRLRTSGTTADLQLRSCDTSPNRSGASAIGLQMVRRTHLQSLSGVGGSKISLRGETSRSLSLRHAG